MGAFTPFFTAIGKEKYIYILQEVRSDILLRV